MPPLQKSIHDPQHHFYPVRPETRTEFRSRAPAPCASPYLVVSRSPDGRETEAPGDRWVIATWTLTRQNDRWLLAAHHNCPA